MSYADEHPGYAFSTREDVVNWIEQQVRDVEATRVAVDTKVSVPEIRRAYSRWLVKHGGVLGSLMMAHRLGKIEDVAYSSLRARVMATMAPTIIKAIPERRKR